MQPRKRKSRYQVLRIEIIPFGESAVRVSGDDPFVEDEYGVSFEE